MGAFVVVEGKTIENKGELEVFYQDFSELWRGFAKEVRTHIDTLGNSPEDTLIGVRQVALNCPWVLKNPSLAVLADRFADRPCVCVASGPSLEKNIHLLKGMEDRCLIISADTALRRLFEEGIHPHAVVTLERPVHTYTNYFRYLVENWPDECADVLLVSQGVSPPQIQGRWPGPKIIVGKSEVPVDSWFLGALLGGSTMRSGMSVAHMGLVLAQILGAKNVALIGQDLAFGEDGSSHAGSTAASSAQSLEKERGKSNYLEIPGSLGGTVKTHNTWFLFLQIFENLIPGMPLSVFDCTEGGAFINGTEVKPLSEFIDAFVSSSSPMEKAPGDLVLENTGMTEEKNISEILKKIERGLKGLDWSLSEVDELDRMVDRTVAAGLGSQKRRDIASEMSERLDRLNGINPVLAFVGQSYANLSGMDIVRTRWLESVSDIREWEAIHREMFKAHRICAKYMKQWLGYVSSLLKEILSDPEMVEKAKETSLERWFRNGEDAVLDISGTEMVSFNLMMAQNDPVAQGWPLDYRWRCALVLHGQGRAEEAFYIMESVAAELQGTRLENDVMVQFLKDYAMISSTHDLCFIPQYKFAKMLLDNARRYAPEDQEIPKLIDEAMTGLKTYLDDLSHFRLVSDSLGFDTKRLEADRLLTRGDLIGSMKLVLEIIDEYHKERPGGCAPLLEWLVKTSVDCLDAQDPSIAETSQEICRSLAKKTEIFKNLRVLLPMRLMEFVPQDLKLMEDISEKKMTTGGDA
nr:6-hydroxymethylpterin diphosphokinase MptE-like protein [Dethiosulfovibrio faecalis]